jgi:hypothetical protein
MARRKSRQDIKNAFLGALIMSLAIWIPIIIALIMMNYIRH